MARAKKRCDSMKEFLVRYENENRQFTEYENMHTFHYHLRNDRPFIESVNKVCEWITKEIGGNI